jgi:predicted lipid carrier protein YhbT
MSKVVLPRDLSHLREQCATTQVSCHVIQEKQREREEGERGENIERQDLEKKKVEHVNNQYGFGHVLCFAWFVTCD